MAGVITPMQKNHIFIRLTNEVLMRKFASSIIYKPKKKNMHFTKIVKPVVMILLSVFLCTYSVHVSLAQQYTFKNKALDLRPEIKKMGLSVRNQGARGTCTIFSTTFLIEFFTARKSGEKNLDLSEEYLNAVTNRAINSFNDGSFYSDALIGYGQFGMVSEEEVPYAETFDPLYLQGNDAATLTLLEKGKKSRFLMGEVEISPNANNSYPGLTDAQFNKLLAHLDKGNPVGIGYGGNNIHGKLFTLDNGKKAFDSANVTGTGAYAHSIPLVGYKVDKKVPGGGYVIFRNSGGASWGDEGYGYMTFNYVKNFTYDYLFMSPMRVPVRTTVFNMKELENRYLSLKDILKKHSEISKRITVPYLNQDGLQRINSKLK